MVREADGTVKSGTMADVWRLKMTEGNLFGGPKHGWVELLTGPTKKRIWMRV
jgi:hypothetical protein